ncbi:hypothetical protein IW249_005168 [Micromonospora vinacea]|uniref:Uncharacterized protein n=1 Tax=Micromonospora vinacea TaxID=709878 RepID=A0ABS0K9V1_9ACTN|nr:hypothetical protein [Micromonospora vinacea]MBG6104754.1 hypothetical protein [Micromonospora vinacea]
MTNDLAETSAEGLGWQADGHAARLTSTVEDAARQLGRRMLMFGTRTASQAGGYGHL